MAGMFNGDGSSSVTSSPVTSSTLQLFPWSLSPGIGSSYHFLKELKSEERGLCLIHLLLACANQVSIGNIENANVGLEQISHLASPDGDTMQRIAAYFIEALADRILKSWPGLHKALNSTKILLVPEEILAQRLFFELCPFLKLAYVITNQAIIEAMEGERMIHIIDFKSCEPAQWMNLFQTLKDRPDGPPHLRITGIHEQNEVLEQMALQLSEEAEKWDIPFQFTPVVSKLENLDLEALKIKTGEALAVSSVLELHSILATDDDKKMSPSRFKNLQKRLRMKQRTLGEWLETDSLQVFSSPDSTSVSSPSSLNSSQKMNSFLSALWGLSPKVMVITEQESNLNGSAFMERVLEALNFYAALFDCLESTMSRSSIERQKVEKMLLGEEIKNIIACEGAKRTERHEKLEKWILRLESVGFRRVPLSYHNMVLGSGLLHNYGYDGYKIKEENGFLFICWQDRPLFSVSAWGFHRQSL